jgi:tetratricopeptide (TPR) repeat protein
MDADMSTPEEWMDEGNGALALGELERAVDCYRRAVELDPEFFDGWQALGMALVKTNRPAEAVEALKRAVELRPDDQMAWSSLSLAYGRNHQIPEAEDAGAKARIISWGGKVSKMAPPKGADPKT